VYVEVNVGETEYKYEHAMNQNLQQSYKITK